MSYRLILWVGIGLPILATPVTLNNDANEFLHKLQYLWENYFISLIGWVLGLILIVIAIYTLISIAKENNPPSKQKKQKKLVVILIVALALFIIPVLIDILINLGKSL